MVVTTRAESARKKEEEMIMREKEAQSMVRPSPVVQGGVREQIPTRLTKGQRRHIQQSVNTSVPHNDCFLKSVDLSSEEVKKLQEEDDSLSRIRQLTSGGFSDSINQAFVKRDSLYFRKWTLPGRGTKWEIKQLVVPKQCREAILKLTHGVPNADHLGKEKTTRRLLPRFYWPGVFADIQDFCNSCSICQRTCQQQPRKAPMIPLPILSEPFSHIAMDTVGPLPKSQSGNKYLLVICDYTTRYPEAIPLRTISGVAIPGPCMGLCPGSFL